jgi:Sugar-transfer associated ATP-grasp
MSASPPASRTTSPSPLETAIIADISDSGGSKLGRFFSQTRRGRLLVAGIKYSIWGEVSCGSQPLLAMLRLPTNASDGRTNLHQGALNVAVDLDSGKVTRDLSKGEEVSEHPDVGQALTDVRVPY